MVHLNERRESLPVSEPLLCEKAHLFAECRDVDASSRPAFKASNGWLWHFCKCQDIRQLTLQIQVKLTPKLSADKAKLTPSRKKAPRAYRE